MTFTWIILTLRIIIVKTKSYVLFKIFQHFNLPIHEHNYYKFLHQKNSDTCIMPKTATVIASGPLAFHSRSLFIYSSLPSDLEVVKISNPPWTIFRVLKCSKIPILPAMEAAINLSPFTQHYTYQNFEVISEQCYCLPLIERNFFEKKVKESIKICLAVEIILKPEPLSPLILCFLSNLGQQIGVNNEQAQVPEKILNK